MVEREQKALLELLYKEMYAVLLSYACASLENEMLADEAVQDTFRIAWSKSAELLNCADPRAWLMLTLKNVIRNTRRELTELNQLFISFELSNNESGQDIQNDLLTHEEYELLSRIVLQKYTISAAAKELGISIESCRKKVRLIKQKLRKNRQSNQTTNSGGRTAKGKEAET